jgi:phosphopantothenoylcysteine decarboxylase/phosphopantothenate--cysteine ligase
VLVTAGPTFEAIDPVRGITNLSSGKMGFAIARAAREAGAEVTLVAGPVHLPTPRGVRASTCAQRATCWQPCRTSADRADVFVATAAVADWRPATQADQKIKKDGSGQPPALNFIENPDILATVAQSPRAQAGLRGEAGGLYCVGFAAESHDLLAHAQCQARAQGRAAAGGQHRPRHVWQDDNALLLVDAQGASKCRMPPSACSRKIDR